MKKTKIVSLKKIVKRAEKLKIKDWDKKDLEGSYMENIFSDNGKAIPLGKKGHLWVRAGIVNCDSVLFLRKEVLDKSISQMDREAIIQRKADIKNGDYEATNYITEDYFDLIDKHLFNSFPNNEEDIKNGYVNLYDYILDEVFSKES